MSDANAKGAVTGHDWWAMLPDPAFLENPYPQLQALREQGPIHLDEKSGIYFVLGHEAFARIVKAPQMGRDTRTWKNGWYNDDFKHRDPVGYRLFDQFQHQMINRDGADHQRMRGMWESSFKAPAMKDLVPMIEAEAARLLECLPDQGPVDLIKAFAGPMPLRVLCNLFDLSEASDDDIHRWSASLIRVGDIMMTAEQKQEALDALDCFKGFLRQLLAERRARHDPSLLSVIIKAEDEGQLTEEETLVNMVSMLIAGHETTVTLIGNGLLLLLKNPEQMERLRADPTLVRPAVEEFLRAEPGGNMILRVALEDFAVAGTTIPAGAPVIGMIGAINRDPARFDDPDSIDVGRASNAHFTFGGGPHICLGAPLARLEGQIAFTALLKRWPKITLDGVPEWRLDRLNARGLATLPVRVG
ncbi:cytochrome P450 [Magnetospirillum sulfuroxidans]|uniref:Cytochrome P450 n=1 Tax=Magnetospirillum sulfuroxidans TaxID=611300 RepID=A0ABS5I7B6_9PROT|nr:cytochrome P450 [Magnetospirillum sulfuroxidans]MBR9970331.1 cytochrome P450 [Magnetospirillum sulfuroxidans]